jgi:phosphoribosylglycinamide formyltransferase-1
MRLGILGSTRGTNLLSLFKSISENKLRASIEVVLSNRADAVILERARSQHVPAYFIDPAGLSRETYDKHLSDLLLQHKIDLIVLIGYMRILSKEFVELWQNKIINVHPSLLPAHAGKMDLDVHRAVLHANEKETGCTVHFVTADVDAGPILLQKRCSVLPHDTPEILKTRVQALEGEALVEAIEKI